MERELREQDDSDGDPALRKRKSMGDSGRGGRINVNYKSNEHDDEWEGLMGEGANCDMYSKGKLPPFEAIKAMFVDDVDKKRRHGNRIEVRSDSDSDRDSFREGDKHGLEEEDSPRGKRSKGNLMSGYCAKSSNTHIL